VEVRYTVTLDDFVAFNLYITHKSGVGRAGYLVFWLGFPFLCVAFAVLLLKLEPTALTVGLALGLCAGAVVWPFTFPRSFRSAQARNTRAFVERLGGRGIIGERLLSLSEEKLVAVSETFRTEVRWENLTGVEEVGDYTYIFLAGISALILPRHGCDSDEEYEAARDFALRKLAGRNEQ
jgi:hypothetical protein